MDVSFRYTISSVKRQKCQKSFLVYSILFYAKFRRMHSFLRCCDSNNILLNEMDKTSRKGHWCQTYVSFCVLLLMNNIMAWIDEWHWWVIWRYIFKQKTHVILSFQTATKTQAWQSQTASEHVSKKKETEDSEDLEDELFRFLFF